jgi:hypothetical protein
MIGRDELFALAAQPIGDRELQTGIHCTGPEAREAARRASKVWLPGGKTSATIARDAERELRVRNFDIEDAIEAAGGHRGTSGDQSA